MITEEEFERSPDAIAGRSRLDAQLKRLSDEEASAFWEAVRRCYASASDEAEGQAST